MTIDYFLEARYDARKSFYKKAIVTEREYKTRKSTAISLTSYNTMVAMVNKYESKKVFHNFGYYSQTTRRHQKEFFKQNGLNDRQLKQLFKDGKITIYNYTIEGYNKFLKENKLQSNYNNLLKFKNTAEIF